MKREPFVIAAMFALVSCAAALYGCGLPVAPTIESIAHAACELVYSDPALKDKLGGKTADEFCQIATVLAPFLEQQKAARMAATKRIAQGEP